MCTDIPAAPTAIQGPSQLRAAGDRGLYEHVQLGWLSTLCACPGVFTWNGGGEWNSRPWSPDLPTDSALLLYTFAAYLQVRWQPTL